MNLAPWAQSDETSRGRRYAEPEHPYRRAFARDRDRVIHCRAFRRLEYKTQVFVNHEGDHFRTRLTHSIEVAQIARTAARALELNEDLAETLALCHDLGHTPFGHLGEDVLSPLMSEIGGFSHNRQTLRIVERLERRYADFPGLNLTWEVREGIAKHSGMPDLKSFPEAEEYLPEVPPPLESQMIDLVDEIAYNHHDLEDGLESELIHVAELRREVRLFSEAWEDATAAKPNAGEWIRIKMSLRRIIDRLVTDMIQTTRERLETRALNSVEQVRGQDEWQVGLSAEVAQMNRDLKAYLLAGLYRHPKIDAAKAFFRTVVEELFSELVARPEKLPRRFREVADREGVVRAVGDYIAGMTDRYALQTHHRVCGGPGPEAAPMATR